MLKTENPACVSASCLFGSLPKREVIFHITAHPLPETSKMGKINKHTAPTTQ